MLGVKKMETLQNIELNIKRIINYKKNKRATYYIEQNNEKKACDLIKIGFIVFEPESWDKLQPVYEAMRERAEFDAKLIVVPSFDISLSIGQYGYEREFFKTKYGEIIEAVNDNGEIIDLKKYDFDYIFYQDPYNSHYPRKLCSDEVVKYSKICYIPYGYTVSNNFSRLYAENMSFFRNVTYFFADTEQNGKIIEKLLDKNIKRGIQKVKYLGFPPFEEYFGWHKNDQINQITWAPRWSYDKRVGGSHFVEYKDEFIKLRGLYKDVKLLLRPHPMLFANMIECGKMTEKEEKEYKKLLAENDIELNDRGAIDDILKKTDLLIADISSIDASFFVTGRPIIYCESKLPPNNEFRMMLEGIYVARDWTEVLNYVKEICSGNDYLYEKRCEILKNNVFMNHRNATHNILEFLIEESKTMGENK